MDDISPELPMGAGDTAQFEDPPPSAISEQQMQDALRSVSSSWLSKLKQADKHKRPFTVDAKEAMQFFDGDNNWFWEPKNGHAYSKIAPPSFRMTVNRAFEAVKLLGSVIYARNPVRTVNPKRFPVIPPTALGIDPSQPPVDPATGMPAQDPRIEQFIATSQQIALIEEVRRTVSGIIESYLNYTPSELNLKEHSRKVVDEGILKGMGVWWTELVEVGGESEEPVGIVGSFFDSVDNLVFDPDADEQEDILWCAKRCVHPVADVAEKYGLSKEDLKGHMESYQSQSTEEADRGYKNKKRNGKTNDLIVYWKIYSKTGFGHNLKGSPKEFAEMFDSLGRNCYIVVAEGVPFPLNVPKDIALEEPPDETGLPNSLFTRTRWPIPFYADGQYGWPFTPLQFHRKPGYSWPISHLKPGMPELKFLNWAMSFLATRLMVSSKTMVGVAKSAGDDIKDQILKHEASGFSLIELSETLGKSINDIVSVFQMPQISPEFFTILQAVQDQFDKRVGLTELVFGMTRNQFRSAAEAQVKSEQISVRPDDMAAVLEDAMSALARKEALAARWLLGPRDVAPVLGPLGAEVWQQMLDQTTIDQLAREYEYRIEAGSARKPNKAGLVEKANMAVQTLGPILQSFAMQGQVAPLNALLKTWCDALDIDSDAYMIQPPPPPPPVADPSQPPDADQSASPGGGGSAEPQQVPPEMMG